MVLKKCLFLLFATVTVNLSAQELVEVTNDVLTVNSRSAYGGNTRNKADVVLPEKTIGYIYRISVFPKGHASVDDSLFDLLKLAGSTNISLVASFAKYAIRNNDSNSVDAFIFNNVYDADNFFSKNDTNWSACKTMTNRASCCFATTECMGQRIFFGFRNNNLRQGLDVKLEVVALVDKETTTTYKYTYAIKNATSIELEYSLSTDNINWKSTKLRSGYLQNFSLEHKEIYFKIDSTANKSVHYTLTPGERYQISWNIEKECWDLTRY